MATLHIAGSRVEYFELGRGEPAVLLHSTGSSGSQWRVLAEELGQRYRVLVPDLYGYGGTANWPGLHHFHLEHEAEIALALLARAGERAHLVGHSYGGAVALHVAGQRSDLLQSLVLIEPAAFHLLRETGAPEFAEIAAVASSIAHPLECGAYEAGFECFVEYWRGPNAWAEVPADKRGAMAARLPKVILDFHAAFEEPARMAALRMMALPTLLLQGTHSPAPTRRICKLLARTLPDAQLQLIQGAGHMSPLTHRDAVNALVVAHIASNSCSTAAGAPSESLAAVLTRSTV